MAKADKGNAAPAAAENKQEKSDIRDLNIITDNISIDAFDEIEKERDEKKKNDLKTAICVATYNNLRTRAELRARRREDDITKEKLDATKKLLERVIGLETEVKDGKLVPIKDKKIPKDQLLTLNEYKAEKNKMEEEFRKKSAESDKTFNSEIQELRSSYEGRYCYCYWWD